MEQKTINQNKLQTILCIIALTFGVLVSAVLYSMPPVHATETITPGTTIYRATFYANEKKDVKKYVEYKVTKTDSVNYLLYHNNSNTRTFVLYTVDTPVDFDLYYLDGQTWDGGGINFAPNKLTSSNFQTLKLSNGSVVRYITGGGGEYQDFNEFTINDYCPIYIGDSALNAADFFEHLLVAGDLKPSNEPPNTEDSNYSFTGFTMNGKTARWTGTTERSYLKDQEVEEYTTITYAWATTTEPDNIGTFQEYNGEFPTSAKQLKLPWSDMESGKVDFQFIRQVNIIPCYRVPGAFYHGQAVKIFFKPDGSIEKVSDPNVTGVLDESIPIPILSVDNDQGTFVFTNAQNDYKFELKGRFWSTDDFYIYRNTPSLVWQYKYLTLLKNSLTTWVSVGDNKSVLDTFSFGDLGNESWQDLLNTYPIDQRNIITGQEQGWFSWANITGYNDAVSTLKMLLNSPYSLFNGYEVYVRYYVIGNDGIVKYSKWTHYFNNLASADGSTGSIVDDAGNMNNGSQSDKGLTDNDLNNVENSGNSRNDVDAKPSSDFGSVDIGDISGIFDQFLSVLKGLYSGMGQLPSFINAIFGFLPAWVTTMIGISIVFIIFLRILGR